MAAIRRANNIRQTVKNQIVETLLTNSGYEREEDDDDDE